jgi:hypothetical protein
MSGYVREKRFEVQFDGDVVTGTLAPLTQADLLTMMGVETDSVDSAALGFREYLKRYVKNFVGPKAVDGSQVTLDEVCESAYFLKLVADIGTQLLQSALPPSPPSETSAS